MTNFWKKLHKPFLVLAPMEDVTDVVFREVIATVSPPDVFFTEFTSAEGLVSPGYDRVATKLKYTENQRPIVAQIWGIHPDKIAEATKEIVKLGFDGIDLNMGCPDKTIMKKGAGGALCTNPKLAGEIINAVKSESQNLSISVKTRLGYNSIITDEWISHLLTFNLSALTIHGRTAIQMSDKPANWDEIGKAVKLRDEISPETTIVGNGDIKNFHDAKLMHEKYNVDGVMIARGVFANPWVFDKSIPPKIHEKEEYLEILLRHLDLFLETWGDTKNFDIMKKFFKMYVNNFDGASILRQKLMECKSKSEVVDVLENNL